MSRFVVTAVELGITEIWLASAAGARFARGPAVVTALQLWWWMRCCRVSTAWRSCPVRKTRRVGVTTSWGVVGVWSLLANHSLLPVSCWTLDSMKVLL